jgi:hypothetical protein
VPRRALLVLLLFASACGGEPARYLRPDVRAPDPPAPDAVSAPTVVARPDPALGARIVGRRPLRYEAGADAATGRPAHVRAGSAIVWWGGRLAVVQDDALFLALVEPESARTSAVVLPAGEGGARLFDDTLGNKAKKLDLEAAVLLGGHLYAFGSGSTPGRELVVIVRDPGAPAVVAPAHRLYAALRDNKDFSGSELNLEGAAVIGDEVVLLQRGNGAPRDGLLPVNASGRLDVRSLVAYLDSGDALPPPALHAVTRYDLGDVNGVRLTFTDAASLGERLVFLAAAEASPDAVRDGAVVGAGVGVIEPDGRARTALLRDERGQVLAGKAEGIALDPNNPARAFIVLDPDDPGVPTELCEVELGGF